jgi:hypothetical protein
MRKAFAIALFGTAFVCALVLFPAAVSAGHLDRTQTLGGMTIYLGLVPAKLLRQHPGWYPDHEQAKVPSGRYVHHVMLALFDNSTGARITNAVVKARVAPLALAGQAKALDPTVVAGALTYCNYFRISPSDTTEIWTEIRRPDMERVTRARFVLEGHAE